MATTRDGDSRFGDSQKDQLQELLRQASDVYPELCALARRCLRGERAGRVSHPMGLVHEALLRIDARRRPQSSAHLLGVMAHAMRRVLIDRARRRRSWANYVASRDADESTASEDAGDLAFDEEALSRALVELGSRHPRAARVAALRYLEGWSVRRTARALGVSPRTVNADWTLARAWLARALESAR